jgi:glutathione peroxidase
MAKRVKLAGLLLAAAAIGMAEPGAAGSAPQSKGGFAFEFTDIDGGKLALSKYAGHPLLVVNTASQCGYTPQYEGLEALWRRYRERGLIVLGVPSNDFGEQEPGDAAEIKQFCTVNFDVDFPMTEKYRVTGPAAHPFYQWVAAELGEGHTPSWNFYKYLVAPDGSLAGAWPSSVTPMSAEITGEIDKLLAP